MKNDFHARVVLRAFAGEKRRGKRGPFLRGLPSAHADAADDFRRQLREGVGLALGGGAALGVQAHLDDFGGAVRLVAHEQRQPGFFLAQPAELDRRRAQLLRRNTNLFGEKLDEFRTGIHLEAEALKK